MPGATPSFSEFTAHPRFQEANPRERARFIRRWRSRAESQAETPEQRAQLLQFSNARIEEELSSRSTVAEAGTEFARTASGTVANFRRGINSGVANAFQTAANELAEQVPGTNEQETRVAVTQQSVINELEKSRDRLRDQMVALGQVDDPSVNRDQRAALARRVSRIEANIEGREAVLNPIIERTAQTNSLGRIAGAQQDAADELAISLTRLQQKFQTSDEFKNHAGGFTYALSGAAGELPAQLAQAITAPGLVALAADQGQRQVDKAREIDPNLSAGEALALQVGSGAANAALERFGFDAALGRIFRGTTGKLSAAEIARRAAVAGVAEGATEVAQSAISNELIQAITGEEQTSFSQEDLRERAIEFAVGATLGSAVSGVSSGVQNALAPSDPTSDQTTSQLEQRANEATFGERRRDSGPTPVDESAIDPLTEIPETSSSSDLPPTQPVPTGQPNLSPERLRPPVDTGDTLQDAPEPSRPQPEPPQPNVFTGQDPESEARFANRPEPVGTSGEGGLPSTQTTLGPDGAANPGSRQFDGALSNREARKARDPDERQDPVEEIAALQQEFGEAPQAVEQVTFRPRDGGGQEHSVWIDRENNVVTKEWHNQGLDLDLTVDEYADSQRQFSEIFGVPVEFQGISSDGFPLVTQPFVEGESIAEQVSLAEGQQIVDEFMAERGFRPFEAPEQDFDQLDNIYINDDGVRVKDAHAGNFIRDAEGNITPIDLHIDSVSSPTAQISQQDFDDLRTQEAELFAAIGQAAFGDGDTDTNTNVDQDAITEPDANTEPSPFSSQAPQENLAQIEQALRGLGDIGLNLPGQNTEALENSSGSSSVSFTSNGRISFNITAQDLEGKGDDPNFILDEEATHLAELVGAREEWRSAGSEGSFIDFVNSRAEERVRAIDAELTSLPEVDRTAAATALVDSVRIYTRDESNLDFDALQQIAENDGFAGVFDAVGDSNVFGTRAAIYSEFLRQASQLQRTGRTSETSGTNFVTLRARVIEAIQEALARITRGLTALRSSGTFQGDLEAVARGRERLIIPDAVTDVAPQGVSQDAVDLPDVTGPRNSIIDQERQELGLRPREEIVRQSNPEIWDQASRENADGLAAQNLIAELNETPRPLNALETGILAHEQVSRRHRVDRQIARINGGDLNSHAAANALIDLEVANQELTDLFDVLQRAGTLQAQAFQARQLVIDDKYDLVTMQATRRARKGRPLNQKELEEVQSIFNRLESSTSSFESAKAREDYAKLEARDIEEALPRADRAVARAKRAASEVVNLPRAFLTAIDISAIGIQGGFSILAGNREVAGSALDSFKAMSSEARAFQVNEGIVNDPSYNLAKQFVAIDPGIADPSNTTQKEELLRSNIAQNLPFIAGSNRGYQTFLNKLRLELFKKMTEGITPDDTTNLRAIGNFVNASTGRGAQNGVGGDIGGALLFSPNYWLSRVRLVSIGAGVVLDPRLSLKARGRIARQYAGFAATVGAIYSAVALRNSLNDEEDQWTIEQDIRSSDFLKIRIGNDRVDPWVGMRQNAVYLGQLFTGQRKSITSGNVVSTGRANIAWQIFRTKASPIAGNTLNVLEGTDVIGQPAGILDSKDISPTSAYEVGASAPLVNALIPISANNFIQAMREEDDVTRKVARGAAAFVLNAWQTFDTENARRDSNGGVWDIISDNKREANSKDRNQEVFYIRTSDGS